MLAWKVNIDLCVALRYIRISYLVLRIECGQAQGPLGAERQSTAHRRTPNTNSRTNFALTALHFYISLTSIVLFDCQDVAKEHVEVGGHWTSRTGCFAPRLVSKRYHRGLPPS